MEKLLIIDGNSIINRSFYALPLLSNSKGEYSNAVYGFINTLTKIILDFKPKYIAVAFDASKKTFRNEIYENYKGNRKQMPNELAFQLPILKKLLKTINIKYFEKENFEADDIIGTLSKIPNVEKFLLSGDKDLFQLLNNETSMLFPKKGVTDIEVITPETLKLLMGITPSQICDYKALRGDSSDNIPGVPGIGEKGAIELLLKFKTLDNIFNNLGEINGKLKEKLENGKNLAYISKKLAQIKTDVTLEYNLNDLIYTFPYSKNTYDFFTAYEFKSLLKRSDIFENKVVDATKNKIKSFEVITLDNIEQLKKVIGYIKAEQKFAFDFTTNQFKFACTANNLYIIKDDISLFNENLTIEQALEELKELFENKKIKKISYDIKANMHLLNNYGINILGEVFDISIAKYLLNQSHEYTELEPTYYFFLEKNLTEMMRDKNLIDLYNKIEIPLTYVLFSMENNGLFVDLSELVKLKNNLNLNLKTITENVFQLAGEEFNLNSPKQLSNILFNKLKLKAKNNKKLSTNVEILQEIENQHEIVPKILKYRKTQKLLTTYIEPFYDIAKKNKDYIRTVFNQTLTTTGRLSSSEPNLQNIPIRDEEGKKLRKIFVSRFKNGQMISADYNQIELRLMAHYSQDQTLISAFNKNEDIHSRTASEILNIPLKDITANDRRLAKTVNFGIIYGISEYGLSINLDTSISKASEYIKNYFNHFPGVKKYMNDAINLAKDKGYAKTLFGRIRLIPELSSTNNAVKKFGERVAINMPLQGTASDIIKLAMINVFNRLDKEKLKSKLVLQIHDELIVDSPNEEVLKIKKILSEEMENVVTLSIPLPVEISNGNSLYDC